MSDMASKKESEQEQRANARQVGGSHYKVGNLPEHWDLSIMYGWDPFQYQITKYVMRWKDKNGIQDLEKAAHFLQKYIEAAKDGYQNPKILRSEFNPPDEDAALFGPNSASGTLTGREHLGESRILSAMDVKFGDMPETKRSGFQKFTYEGGTAEWDLFTCKTCRREVRVKANTDPNDIHGSQECFEGIPPLNPELGQSK